MNGWRLDKVLDVRDLGKRLQAARVMLEGRKVELERMRLASLERAIEAARKSRDCASRGLFETRDRIVLSPAEISSHLDGLDGRVKAAAVEREARMRAAVSAEEKLGRERVALIERGREHRAVELLKDKWTRARRKEEEEAEENLIDEHTAYRRKTCSP